MTYRLDGLSDESPPRLAVDGLTVAFGGLVALRDVSFTVDDGETVALIGPNGAGKTTAFNAVCALVRPSAGTIRIAGRPAPSSTVRLPRAGVSRTLQGLGLFDHLTVTENVLAPLTGLDGSKEADRAATERILDRLGLAPVARSRAGLLPYPERKRVALARALVTEPRLLLLDEPAGGLGADDIADLADTVREVSAGGCAIGLVEHHVDFVMDVADRIVVLDFGEVIATGTPDEIRGDRAVETAYLGLTDSPATGGEDA